MRGWPYAAGVGFTKRTKHDDSHFEEDQQYLKEEYKKVESEVGLALEKIL